MTLRKLMIVAFSAASAAYSVCGAAAPFCVDVTGLPQQCLFVDPNSCRTEATRQGGQCVANSNELTTPPRSQAFCMVTAGNVMSCTYPDRADCDREARQLRGACIPSNNADTTIPAPASGVDPYQVKRPY
jgi:hypothetical protein